MIAYHDVSYGIASRLKIFPQCTLRLYGICMTVSTNNQTPVEIIESFPVKVGLH